MQKIIIDEPYKFVKPVRGKFWLKLFQLYVPHYLRKSHGLVSWKTIGKERLARSISQGHGIMLAPNHCRPCDPMLLGMVCKELKKPSYMMGSWHLFMQDDFYAKILPKVGVFSIYREGIDRESLKFAINALSEAERMLILFPEGIITRTNNRVNQLMEGTSFIARSAAKKRLSKGNKGKTVIHPVAIRYFFDGDIEETVSPVLDRIEHQLTWQPSSEKNLLERIDRIGNALLDLQEIQYFGKPQTGVMEERLHNLTERLLVPLEKEWLKTGCCDKSGDVVARVKKLRMAILPEMASGRVDDKERARRWKQLEDTYLAQQLYLYPPGYLGDNPEPEQILETVERLEEDMTDKVTVHAPLRAVIEIGDAIEVNPERDKSRDYDPLMEQVHETIHMMLEKNRMICSNSDKGIPNLIGQNIPIGN